MNVGKSKGLKMKETEVVVIMDVCTLEESVDKFETLLWRKQVEEETDWTDEAQKHPSSETA